MNIPKRKLFIGSVAAGFTGLALLPLVAAFEAHVVNVTARIENALFVHPESLEYGTVFPQEHLDSSFLITFSQSFSQTLQNRVGKLDYLIKQKPKPRESFRNEVGVEAARDFCHENGPANVGDPNDPYYAKCFPNLCPYLSKHPDNIPATGPNANNDVGVTAFHYPDDPASWAKGKMVKFNSNGNTIGNDPSDNWTIDLAVPCFKGMCAQDWQKFVATMSASSTINADDFTLPPGLEHQVFGCDLWVEVTKIY